MTTNRGTQKNQHPAVTAKLAIESSYYGLLGLHPAASGVEIRRSYRELSKRYHPDTTTLPPAIAKIKFQELNEAYATLSNPERRLAYDYKIGYSRVAVVQPLPNLYDPSSHQQQRSSSAYLDPTDRPLSPGEIFALFSILVTFAGCILLAIAVALTRPEAVIQPLPISDRVFPDQVSLQTTSIEQSIAPTKLKM